MEYLFTEENLKMILAPPGRTAKLPGDCPICARISSAIAGENTPGSRPAGSFPGEASSRLEDFIMVKNSWHILKCPLCSRLYTDEYRYDHLVGGREDEYRIAGIEYAEALELLKGIKGKKTHEKRLDLDRYILDETPGRLEEYEYGRGKFVRDDNPLPPQAGRVYPR